MSKRRLIAGIMPAALLAWAAACGGATNEKASSPTVRPTTAGTQSTGAPVQPGTATPLAGSSLSGGTAIANLTVVANGTRFEQSSLQAKAGQVTITFDNQDAGIRHNLHVYRGSSASGESVGMTEIKTGPAKDTLSVNLTAGEYHVQCDVHPTMMSATLTVT